MMPDVMGILDEALKVYPHKLYQTCLYTFMLATKRLLLKGELIWDSSTINFLAHLVSCLGQENMSKTIHVHRVYSGQMS